MTTKKHLWAIQTKQGNYVTWGYYEYAFNTALFKTKKHADIWLEDNGYWKRLGAKVVRVTVTVKEYMSVE